MYRNQCKHVSLPRTQDIFEFEKGSRDHNLLYKAKKLSVHLSVWTVMPISQLCQYGLKPDLLKIKA